MNHTTRSEYVWVEWKVMNVHQHAVPGVDAGHGSLRRSLMFACTFDLPRWHEAVLVDLIPLLRRKVEEAKRLLCVVLVLRWCRLHDAIFRVVLGRWNNPLEVLAPLWCQCACLGCIVRCFLATDLVRSCGSHFGGCRSRNCMTMALGRNSLC